MINDAHWSDPITETRSGIDRDLADHQHYRRRAPDSRALGAVQVLDRQAFDTSNILPISSSPGRQPPENNERPAWKDTIISYPGTVTRIISKFDLPPGQTRGRPEISVRVPLPYP